MLFNKHKDRIAELEAEIKSLRQKLHDAEAVIVVQKSQIDKLSSDLQMARDKVTNSNTQKAKRKQDKESPSHKLKFGQEQRQIEHDRQAKERQITINLCKSTLRDYIKQDLQNRWLIEADIGAAKLTSPMSNERLREEIASLFEKGGRKSALIKRWQKLGETEDINQKFTSIFPFIFDIFLKEYKNGNHWNNKKPKIVYNSRSYLILFNEIIPCLVSDFKKKKEEEERKQRKREEERRKREEERRKREEERKHKHEVDLHEDWPLYLEQINEALNIHSVAFMRNMRAAYQKDDYGAVFKDEREVEVERFLRSVNLIQRAKKHGIKKTVQHINRWYAKKKRELEQAEAAPENGHDFEHWVAAQLNNAGWTAMVTQASGDDGVDVIAERDGVSVAVQCKRFKGSVGNKAVQEVYSGMKHMQLDRAVVISTGKYTKASENLATTTGVLLLSEHDIPHMWDLLQK